MPRQSLAELWRVVRAAALDGAPTAVRLDEALVDCVRSAASRREDREVVSANVKENETRGFAGTGAVLTFDFLTVWPVAAED